MNYSRYSKAFLAVISFALLIIQVYPLVWVFISSFKAPTDFSSSNPLSLPSKFTFENYLSVWRKGNLGTYFSNSLIVAVTTIVLVILFSAMAAFVIEKMRFKWAQSVLFLFLCGIMIPIQVVLIPLFILYNKTGIINTLTSLILPQVGFALPISIYLFVSFYKYISNEIMEAAVMDGCGIYQVFWRMIFPLSRNTIVTVVVMNLIFIWNEFIFANTFIHDLSSRTIPVGLMDYIGQYGLTDWGATYAAISITTIPTMLVYFIFNKSVISGMTAGATKG
ncbi:raffinose/stachyose/melibiose transport system permease protein [Paenibacillus sophorae]|uniref:Carbohydrate ABC transporter permease n=1 Tax=Paenibacillus sophorae TaxID=1333845 RepID=A0A1H8SEZ6_9BACL|nr:carbohydrate ABC transporter permease [Paenibacillus sophorae]QWU16743.1 carbohydrate ABC transporter permease [Paenibacillus sophorae]SEO77145.1 raffinose/stachyose/melibiose transport system permease protein [Paenibacillus sophorae]